MKKSMKAALLSGLVFPGIGHMVLQKYLRGSILMASALLALSVIVTIAVRRALSVVDSMSGGQIPLESGAITELAASSLSGADSLIANICLIVLGVSWLVGIIDSYRLGNSRRSDNS